MANSRVIPTNIWEIPRESIADRAGFLVVYERKEAGRDGFTQYQSDQNATLVKDTDTGDVYFTDSVIAGSTIYLVRGQLAILALPLV